MWNSEVQAEFEETPSRYLLLEEGFVLVLLLELLLGGLVGKNVASSKLWGLDVGETYERRLTENQKHRSLVKENFDKAAFSNST